MKKVPVVMYSALLLLLGSACSQAQQSLASTRNGDSNAGSQAVSNVSGSGVKDYIPLWLSGSKLGTSNIYQSEGNIGIDMSKPAWALDVNGHINTVLGFNLAGSPFAFGSLANGNAFFGFSGNSTMTGLDNTATGLGALESNTSGAYNSATGVSALQSNTSGQGNVATGEVALVAVYGKSESQRRAKDPWKSRAR